MQNEEKSIWWIHACRVCLRKEPQTLQPLEAILLSKFTDCAPINAFSINDLPMFICVACSKDLDVSYSFRKRCIETALLLNKHIQRENENNFNSIKNDIKLEIMCETSNDSTENDCPLLFDRTPNEEECNTTKETKYKINKRSLKTINDRLTSCEQISKDEKSLGVINKRILENKTSTQIEENYDTNNYQSIIDASKFMELSIFYQQDKSSDATLKIRKNLHNAHPKIYFQIFSNDKCPVETNEKIRKKLKKFSCTLCEKELLGRKHFLEHLKIHPDYKRYLCSYCAKGFKSACTLEAHLRVHTGARPFKCNECEKSFRQRAGLRAHHRSLHTLHRPFACPDCNASFARKETLIIHQRVHNGARPFSCNICSRTFTQAGNLQAHERAHTGEQPFTCTFCDFRTAYPSALKKHIRAHTGEKNYVCKICGKSFRDNTGLRKHIRIHTGDLPYKCSECSRAFIDSWKRSQHIKKSH